MAKLRQALTQAHANEHANAVVVLQYLASPNHLCLFELLHGKHFTSRFLPTQPHLQVLCHAAEQAE